MRKSLETAKAGATSEPKMITKKGQPAPSSKQNVSTAKKISKRKSAQKAVKRQ